MLIFDSNITDNCYSSLAPDIIINCDNDTEVTVSVTHDNNTILELTLFPYAHTVTLFELSRLLTDFMRDNDLVYETFSINAEQGASTISKNLTVLFCTDAPVTPVTDFIEKNFLSVIREKLSPMNKEFVHFIGNDSLTAVILTDSDTHNISLTATTSDNINSCEIDFGAIAQSLTIDVDDIKACIVKAGVREMAFYRMNHDIRTAWKFKNAFNLWEYFETANSSTSKTSDQHKNAVVNALLVPYDFNKTQEHELQTAPMTISECIWATQLIAAPKIIDNKNREIIITDAKTEFSDKANEMQSIAFTWQFKHTKATFNEDGYNSNYARIHSQQYDTQYN